MSRTAALLVLSLIPVAGCHRAQALPPVSAPARTLGYEVSAIALPGAPPGPIFLDYLAVDRARGRVWVPAGPTGSVDVIEVASRALTRIEGFPTAEVERNGRKRVVGPSSASIGEGVVFVGNRGDSTVSAVDAASLHKGPSAKLDSMPDGVVWVAATKEVWVTTPRDRSIRILDASQPGALTVKDTVRLEGEPEGYAVDDAAGLFFTNLEDKDRTLVLDVKTRTVQKTWLPGCGEAGPRCLALDEKQGVLMVACTDHVVALDTRHDGKLLSRIDTGKGVDSIDWVDSRRELFVAAAEAASLSIVRLDDAGVLRITAVVPTAPGARNAVAADDGTAFIADPQEGKVLVVAPPASPGRPPGT